jgi:hypothetical protein
VKTAENDVQATEVVLKENLVIVRQFIPPPNKLLI